MNDDSPKDDVAANDDENAMSDDSCDMNKEWNNDHESLSDSYSKSSKQLLSDLLYERPCRYNKIK